MNNFEKPNNHFDWEQNHAAIWRGYKQSFRQVNNIDPILDSLSGIGIQKDKLIYNTERFLNKQPSNNALLWGARGTGKSSLIKAIFNQYRHQGLRLIEVDKDDLSDLPEIIDHIDESPYRFILFCDDLSFDDGEHQYKHLKSVLEGSIESPPENIKIYASSNRRHILPESMQDNINVKHVNNEIHPGEAIDEKISLSDRFGLWISFYPPSLAAYLDIVDSYFSNFKGDRAMLHQSARRFAHERGTMSGRTAKQSFNYYSADE